MTTYTPPQRTVLWGVWFSLFASLFIYRAVLSASPPEGDPSVGAGLLIMLIAPLAGSVFIRWILLPKAKDVPQTLVFSIIGISLAESLVFFGIFLFPASTDLFFLFSVLGVLQFVPIYAHRGRPIGSGFREG